MFYVLFSRLYFTKFKRMKYLYYQILMLIKAIIIKVWRKLEGPRNWSKTQKKRHMEIFYDSITNQRGNGL